MLTLLTMVFHATHAVINWAERKQQELVDAILGGDEKAFAWLVKKHWGGMMRVARGIMGSESLATEVVQETFEAVFKGLDSFRGESSLSTWMFRILINRARRTGKREARSIPFSSMGSGSSTSDDVKLEEEFTANGHWSSPVHGWSNYDPQQEAINHEGLKMLSDCLEKLPYNQRIVVALRDVEGLGSQEACELLEISPDNQRQLLHRGRTKLRLMLEALEKDPPAAGQGAG